MAKKTRAAGRRKAAKRERINTGTDKRFVRRSPRGTFKESDDVAKSLSADRRKKAKTKVMIGEYLVADSLEAVVSLAQMGVVEIHTWNSTIEDIERPNRVVWDLDPRPDVTWKQVVTAARLGAPC